MLSSTFINCQHLQVHRSHAIFNQTDCITIASSSSQWLGTIFEQPLVRVDNLAETLTALRARGVRCLAAHPRPGATKLARADLRGDCCLVFGAEGPGLTADALAACDEMVEIPMPSHMNSLNVAVATGIFLYEATRQRG